MYNVADRVSMRNAVEECLLKAKELFGFNKKVEVTFDLRGRAAGQATVRPSRDTWHIRLNPEAHSIAPNDMLRNIIPHELAHLVSYWAGNGMNHSPKWKRICTMLGGDGARCHQMALTPAKAQVKYAYRTACGTETVLLGSVRHKRLQRGVSSYSTRSGKDIPATGFVGKA